VVYFSLVISCALWPTFSLQKTAFLILTIELFGMTDFAAVYQIAWYRIIDNVIGALIALFFGLLVPQVLIRMKKMQATSIPKIRA